MFPTAAIAGAVTGRNLTGYLVPGVIQYEPAGGIQEGDSFYNTIGSAGNLHGSWGLVDASNDTGTSVAALARPTYDGVHGTKGHSHGDGTLFVVGLVFDPTRLP